MKTKSILKHISNTFASDEEKRQTEILVNKFIKKASELVWGYSPDIKVKSYSLSYSYPYLPPGITSIPPITFESTGLHITLWVEAEYVTNTTLHVHPDSVNLKKIGLHLKTSSSEEVMSIEYGDDRKVYRTSLPSSQDLKTCVQLLEFMEKEHQRIKTPHAPKGHSDY